ncbi:MAG: sugar phosphate isomerase/epimerase family protein, partial [Thermoguttaceae bacterium]
DWDLGMTGNPDAFKIGKELGFEGVEVSFEPEGEFSLRKKDNRKVFLDAAKKEDMQISSLAMGVLNGRPLATVPEAEEWVSECVDSMQEMEVNNVLLAFFGDGDIKDNTDARKTVVEKLKKLAPKAEKTKRVLGVESYLNAKEHLEMLEAIGNDAVKIYYDEQNMLTKEYPIYEDIELLLKEKAICQIHAKEYGSRLGKGKVDFSKLRALLDKYDYKGWIVVESAVTGDWKESQKENAAFLKKLFS